jgi:hypothetical protein
VNKRASSAVIAVAFIVAPFFVATPVRDLRNWFNAETWKPVPAKVISVDERRARYSRARNEQTELELRVGFTFDGLPRESTLYTHPESFASRPGPGDAVTVRVNPRDPRQALFNPKGDLLFEIITWWGLVALGVGILAWLLVSKPAEAE